MYHEIKLKSIIKCLPLFPFYNIKHLTPETNNAGIWGFDKTQACERPPTPLKPPIGSRGRRSYEEETANPLPYIWAATCSTRN